jgi:transcription-repair coupling factor (superfamily II helicase)
MDLSKLLPLIHRACSLRGIYDRAAASRDRIVVGLLDSAKAPVVAALAHDADGPLLVIAPKPAQAAPLVDELSSWLGDSLPVLQFPERDALPFERLPADPDVLRERLRALDALASSERCVVIVSGAALAQRTLPRGEQGTNVLVRVGERGTPDKLVGALLRLGYRTEPLAERPGEVARRGGIVDVYPASGEGPLRIEFFGDEIESLRRFDVATQRSTERLGEATIGAAREVLDLPAAIKQLAGQLDLSSLNEEMRERFEEELARLAAGDAIPEENFYVPLLASGTLLDHLPSGAFVIVDELADLTAALEEHDEHVEGIRFDLEGRGELPRGVPSPHVNATDLRALIERQAQVVHLSRWALDTRDEQEHAPSDNAASIRLPFAPADGFGGRLRSLTSDVDASRRNGRAIVIVSQQAQRLAELLSEDGVPAALVTTADDPQAGLVNVVQGSLPQGWRLTAAEPPLTLLTDAEVFGFVKQRRRLPKRSGATRDAFLADLTPGDYVVHIEHGIARFSGLVRRHVGDVEREYLELRYSAGDKLFVPAEQVDRVSRFMGGNDQPPSLTRLGSQEWTRAKERVRRAVADLARELLDLYATRHVAEGRAFSPDTAWQQELEASFPYVETPDQLAAVRDVKTDMERVQPMDRLVCGDVGYGKTEVALRAAFKAVMDGSQVAVLVPTTVLAQQHFNTFTERLAGFPVRVDMLSRFRSPREQQAVVDGLKDGSVDIVIGTHRLLQKDVSFKDLGLVVIDEEQRFGVGHKEKLKQVRREVDVLTLSATPIPRTLHMSLSGIRDMSTMETPPEQRLPIKTYVTEYDDHIVREAILRELERGGQVYFVHNRVHDIEMIAAQLRKLVPEAEIAIGHGQQHEDVLEQVMLHFIDGKVDVLVCTTIIESGLDIPNVNTIIIHKADKLGLAQLYQLRGRVGRSAARAYAYLLFEKYRSLSEQAQKRLQAIFEATELGAGFQIAQRDLEIRGAGNLLGADQSGHIGTVGFDLYIRLLSDAVERLKALRDGRTPPKPKLQQQLTIDLPLTAHLPESYVDDLNLRLSLYQRMAAVETTEQAEAVEQELRDRFGPPPPAVEHLLFVVRVRALAHEAGVISVQQGEGMIVVHAGDGGSPRDVLAGMESSALWLGQTQARLDMAVLGDSWPEKLLDVLAALAVQAQRASAAASAS